MKTINQEDALGLKLRMRETQLQVLYSAMTELYRYALSLGPLPDTVTALVRDALKQVNGRPTDLEALTAARLFAAEKVLAEAPQPPTTLGQPGMLMAHTSVTQWLATYMGWYNGSRETYLGTPKKLALGIPQPKLRDAHVVAFAEFMERRLKLRDPEGAWETSDADMLQGRFVESVSQVIDSEMETPYHRAEHLADVAVLAMALAERFGWKG